MIRSMTGFGRGAEKSPYGKVIAEIKTLNHKNLSVSCSPLNGFFLLEEKMKEVLSGKIHRGKVFIRVTIEPEPKKRSLKHVVVNEPVAREYIEKTRKMQKALGLGGELSVRDVVAFPGVVESASEAGEEEIWPYVRKALNRALKNLISFRRSEGASLSKDFNSRLANIKKMAAGISVYGKESVSEYRMKLEKTIKDMTGILEPDKARLESEVALFARNCDIAEELTRLQGHIGSYRESMRKVSGDAGKKLDFIAQEMQREINTIGAKSSDLRIAKAVIEVKSEIERMREQIKNIE